MDTSLTLTTINMPHVIENILENAGESETENLQIVIIGDLKTPIEIEDYVKKIDKSSKAEIVYLSVADQEKLFSKHTNLWNHIPVNSFARRNYADMYAADTGALKIIRIEYLNFLCSNKIYLMCLCVFAISISCIKDLANQTSLMDQLY